MPENCALHIKKNTDEPCKVRSRFYMSLLKYMCGRRSSAVTLRHAVRAEIYLPLGNLIAASAS